MTNQKQKTQNALDSAVLAAAYDYKDNLDKSEAKKIAQIAFQENCATIQCGDGATMRVTIDSQGVVTGNSDNAIHPFIMDIFGTGKLNFTNRSKAHAVASQVFHDIYFALDWCASLGIAATPTDISNLKALTAPYISYFPAVADGCAFACHFHESFIQPTIGGSVVTTYDFAKANGITLREDVLINEVSDTIDELYTKHPPSVRVGIFAFSDSLEEVEPPSALIANVRTKLETASLDRWGTRADLVFPELTTEIGASGAGTSSADSYKTVVIVTDGLNNNYSGGILTSPFAASYCDGFKANGVMVAVLHLKYPDSTGQAWFDAFVDPHYDDIEPNLIACASDGLYFDADSQGEIANALEEISNTLDGIGEKQLALVQ